MKTRQFPLLLLLLAISGTLSAQGLFVRLSPAIALSASGDDVGFVLEADSISSTETVVYGSNGAGVVAGLDLGYMFNENLGLQLGVEYLLGFEDEIISVQEPGFRQSVTQSSQQIRLSPEVIVNAGSGTLSPYGRFGISIPLSSTTQVEFEESNFISEEAQMTEFKAGNSLGFRGAIGVNYSLNDQIILFGEVAGLSQRVRAQSSVVKQWTEDGTSVLDQKMTYQIEKNYVETIDASSNNGTFNQDLDLEKAQDLPSFSTNFTSIMLRIGVSYQF